MSCFGICCNGGCAYENRNERAPRLLSPPALLRCGLISAWTRPFTTWSMICVLRKFSAYLCRRVASAISGGSQCVDCRIHLLLPVSNDGLPFSVSGYLILSRSNVVTNHLRPR